MQSLKKIVLTNLQRLSVVMVILILLTAIFLQVTLVREQAKDNAQAAFVQIEQILEENREQLVSVKSDYRETCLLNAEAIAYFIQHHPEILGNVEEFRKLAVMMQVDEIHIFDTTGRIYTGTHPEYYDYTFDSGEQMNFFKPMLTDKSLELCQDITPNTAEGKLVQYSALWSANEEFIVEVGMYPDTVLEVTQKNELSYIFSLLQGYPGVHIYAINGATGEIIGATNAEYNGKSMKQLGLSFADIARCKNGSNLTLNGVDSYCVFTDMNGIMIGYVIALDQLYKNLPTSITIFALGLILIALMLVWGIMRFTNQYIISSISSTNKKLHAIAEGNLDERIDVRSSLEFSELSDYINNMVKSLLASTDKMSFVLNRTNMPIGVYEYNTKMKTVRFTEHIPDILGLTEEDLAKLVSDYRLLQKYIHYLRQEPLADEENVFHLTSPDGKRQLYIKLEEIDKGNDVLGIIMDITDEIMTRKRIENERDMDLLVGLYNRRGMYQKFNEIFADAAAMGHGALLMIDSDGLKEINDNLGHTAGDEYLKRIADVIRDFGSAKHVSARLSGDEFVLLLYGYSNEAALMLDIDQLRELQNITIMHLENGGEVPVRFSMGYVMTKGRQDYQSMLAVADSYMYENKRSRKLAINPQSGSAVQS